MTKHVIVAAHRRSGTHFVTDAIVNNFGIPRATVDLDVLKQMQERDVRVFHETLAGTQPVVFWTHAETPSNVWQAIPDAELSKQARELVYGSKVVYVYRDGRDVVTSAFHMHNQPDKNFARFVGYRLPVWRKSVLGWIDSDVPHLEVSYEMMIRYYPDALRLMADFLDRSLPPGGPIDVTLREGEAMDPHIVYSTREFRKGIVGDYKNHFTPELLEFAERESGNLLRRLGYV